MNASEKAPRSNRQDRRNSRRDFVLSSIEQANEISQADDGLGNEVYYSSTWPAPGNEAYYSSTWPVINNPDAARAIVSDNQQDSSSYAQTLKAIPQLFHDESRHNTPDVLSATPSEESNEASYAQHLAAIDRIFSDESQANRPNDVSYGDQLESVPQIFHESDTSSDHPAARHFKNSSPVFRDESRGPLTNVTFEAPIDPVQVSPNQPAATTTETEPTPAEIKPAPINIDTSRTPEDTSDSDAQPSPITPLRPVTPTPEASNRKNAESPIDIRTRKRVGRIALAGLFAGFFFTGRASSHLFGQKAK